MHTILIKHATLVNEGQQIKGSLLIKGDTIQQIIPEGTPLPDADTVVDATGKYLLPGVIDDQVHFREPGLTHKGDIASESRAAVAGGITSYMEMPNTNPQTTTIENLEAKYDLAASKSLANYSFYMGATNDNMDELLKVDPKNVCGLKVFMGSSTGNMLVDKNEVLARIFSETSMLITTHCEDEASIQRNLQIFKDEYGDNVPFSKHGLIRSEEACYRSSSKAVELAEKHNARLHLLHLSTVKELSLLDNTRPLSEKRITGEVCVHHLWFDDSDYDRKGAFIKWNPAIKTRADKEGLLAGLLNNKLDVVATDHAPHTLEEKQNSYFKAPSGGPLVQHSLVAMLELAEKGLIPVEKIVEKMCHAPADLFRVERRGYLRPGYFADVVLIEKSSWIVSNENILYKCGWSPFDGETFTHRVTHTFVNGHLVWENGTIYADKTGKRLTFNA